MTQYYSYGVNLSQGQKTRLVKAIQNNSAITLRLANNELAGSDEMMLTKTQIKKVQKAKPNGVGSDVKISKAQVRKAVQHGACLWSPLFSLGAKALPYVGQATSKVLPELATGALSALGCLGVIKFWRCSNRWIFDSTK